MESYYDEDEESEESDLFSEDEEEDEEEDSDWDNDGKEESLSSGSIPSEISGEFNPERPNQQFAQVVPEPPWSKLTGQCFRLAVACSLPILFVCLVVYGLYKCGKCIGQVIFDVYLLVRHLAWFAIRVALSPFYILWKVFVPSFIQTSVAQWYEERIGIRVRKVFARKRSFEETVADFPNIVLACQLAAVETCVRPLQKHGGKLAWHYLGRHIDAWVLKPLQDAHLNRSAASRRKRAQGWSQRHAEAKELMRRMAPKRARQNARKKCERAKRLRAKKKRQQLEITLTLENAAEADGAPQKVQLQDKSRHQMISRTMIVERRYAVAVGIIWFLAGGAVILLTLDGSEGARCTICEDHADVGIKVCRHGSGRDCAFQQYEGRIIGCIAVMVVGCLLLVYAIFLYRPRSRKEKHEAERERRRQQIISDNSGTMHKTKDEYVEAIEFLLEQRQTRTPARMIRNFYRGSRLWTCMQNCSFCMNGPLACIFRWEHKHNCRERSVFMQWALYMSVIGWLQKLVELINRRRAQTPRHDFGAAAGRGSGLGSGLYFAAPSGCWPRFVFWFRFTRCGTIITRWSNWWARTALGRAIGRFVASSPKLQGFLTWISGGLFMASEVVAQRALGGGNQRRLGANALTTLEATLARFGLLEEERQEEVQDIIMEVNDWGLKDTQLESGVIEGDVGVVEEEPEVYTLDKEEDIEEEDESESEDEGDEEAAFAASMSMQSWGEQDLMMEGEESEEENHGVSGNSIDYVDHTYDSSKASGSRSGSW